MAHDPSVFIVDNGTGYIKAGYAGDNLPRQTFPRCVASPIHLRRREKKAGRERNHGGVALRWSLTPFLGSIVGRPTLRAEEEDLENVLMKVRYVYER